MSALQRLDNPLRKPNQTNGETNDKKCAKQIRIRAYCPGGRRRITLDCCIQRICSGAATTYGPFVYGRDANRGAGEAVAERVIVTGSNIPTAAEQASIPVTTYTAQWLQKSGANTPTEGLRQLPTFVGNAETENDSNAGDGTAFINLRGLGAENTLTLINGRRMAGGNGLAADINLLPISSIQKVDILKDGASAIYGLDVVAGRGQFHDVE